MYNIFTLPLRDRKEDIKILVKEIIAEFNLVNKQDKTLTEDHILYLKIIFAWKFDSIKNFLKRCYDFSGNNILLKQL